MRGSILVVDDEPTLRGLTVRILEAAGFQALGTGSGEVALELLRRRLPVDLMVVDVRMPRLNGIELARAAWEFIPDLRVLFISGYAEPVFQESENVALLHDFLPKPYNSEELVAAVRRLLGA